MPRKTSTTKKTTRRKKSAPELIEETESKMENVEQAANEQAATEEVMEEALAAVRVESEDVQSEPEEKPKPKRRAAPRKRSTKKASMDSVAKVREEAKAEAEDAEERSAYAPTFSERIEEMRDIKPKQTADATFLIPEKFSFDLIDKRRRAKKSSWAKKTAYILGGLIIILAVVLIAMTVYSNRLLSQESDLASLTNNDGQNTAATQVSGAAKLSLANVPSDLQALLTSGAQSDLQTVTFDSNPAADIVTADADTLFFKGSVQTQTQPVLDFLAKYGIKAQIQQKDDLQEDMVLYLVTTLKNPDLSLMTSAVYNASGKSGDAKRVCAILEAAKVVSCQALNNTVNQTGTTIFYKDVKAVATLKRMTEFSKATFQKAGSDQVEDIRVVAGK